MRAYMVSLLKAWWGPAATADNDFCFDYLPRLTGSHSTYQTVMAQLAGHCQGYFLIGENPAVGSANAKMQRLGMANLDWLVVRDFSLIESATWWKDGPEIETGEMRTEDIATEVFFFPAAAHTEKSGSFTNTQRMLQWHHAGGRARRRRAQRPVVQLPPRAGSSGRSWPARPTRWTGPVLDLTWDYPTEGEPDEPNAEAVLAEINGWDGDGQPLSSYQQLTDDGSTAVRLLDLLRRLRRRRQPGGPAQARPASRTGWRRSGAGPGRPTGASSTTGPRPIPTASRGASARRWSGGTQGQEQVDRPRRPRLRPDKRAGLPAARTAPTGPDGAGRQRPVHHAGGRQGVVVRPGGPGRRPAARPLRAAGLAVPQPALPPAAQPGPAGTFRHPDNRQQPSGGEPGAEVFPYVVTTYRLTEHHTAGGMSRWLPYLSELQPEMFCEVSPELAAERGLEHKGWATIVTARGAIEARVLVTERMAPLTVQGRRLHQIGLPYHWGANGLRHRRRGQRTARR